MLQVQKVWLKLHKNVPNIWMKVMYISSIDRYPFPVCHMKKSFLSMKWQWTYDPTRTHWVTAKVRRLCSPCLLTFCRELKYHLTFQVYWFYSFPMGKLRWKRLHCPKKGQDTLVPCKVVYNHGEQCTKWLGTLAVTQCANAIDGVSISKHPKTGLNLLQNSQFVTK